MAVLDEPGDTSISGGSSQEMLISGKIPVCAETAGMHPTDNPMRSTNTSTTAVLDTTLAYASTG
jgi:hypothetical protein